jgi:cytidylate kinase
VIEHPAITISRSLGSGGTEAGFLVARRLGWHFCDRRILRLAAGALGQSAASLAPQEERRCGFLDQMKHILAFGSPEALYTPPLEAPVYSRDLFALERGVMQRLAAHAPSVIVGRGGFVALKDRPATLHVCIDADPDFRVRTLMEHGKVPDLEAARKAIAASDRDRAAYIRQISGLAWHDPRQPFHLVLDPSRIGLEGCVRLIVEEAQSRWPRA